MRFCLNNGCVSRTAALTLFVAGCLPGLLSAASVTRQPVSPRVRSVVRADAQGRLVRAVVVSPRVVQPRLVTPAEVSSDAQATASTDAVQGASIPEIVEAAARKHDVDPLLVHSVISTESNYNPYAVSPKGAQGLMQLMPATARRFGVRNTFDVKENIEGGVRYLKYLGSLFPNDPRLAIAAYNAGEGAVWKYGNNIPPYRETEQYVYRVGMKYGKARKQAERKKSEAPVQTAQAGKPAEPSNQPVHVYVDAEGRLYLRNTPPPSESATP
jgi:soluble lytic murein transglycosylase-like protein